MTEAGIKRLIEAMGEAKSLTDGTKVSYAVALRNFCTFMGSLDAAIFADREDASGWAEYLLRISEKIQQNYTRSVSAIFTYLCEEGVLEENVFMRLVPSPHPGLNKPYNEAVSLSEIRRILAYALKVGKDPDSTPAMVANAALAMLHVRYCIPYSSLSNIRVSDYRTDSARSAVSWRNARTGATEVTWLDPDVSLCIDRSLSLRGGLLEHDYLFVNHKGKDKGGRVKDNCLRERVVIFYREAGVSIGRRNLKLAAVQLAASAGAGMAELHNLSSAIGLPMAYKTTKEAAKKSAAELWDAIEFEFEDRVPIAKGVVSVQELKEALDLAAGSEHVRFEVAFDGRLCFNADGPSD